MNTYPSCHVRDDYSKESSVKAFKENGLLLIRALPIVAIVDPRVGCTNFIVRVDGGYRYITIGSWAFESVEVLLQLLDRSRPNDHLRRMSRKFDGAF